MKEFYDPDATGFKMTLYSNPLCHMKHPLTANCMFVDCTLNELLFLHLIFPRRPVSVSCSLLS